MERGISEDEILDDYPDLEMDDIKACIAYARYLVANETFEVINEEINIEAR
jgi:uncharacterized protein (DUF433 family)